MVIMMIKRNILSDLQQELTQPEVLILLGARQTGKTTLVSLIQKKYNGVGV